MNHEGGCQCGTGNGGCSPGSGDASTAVDYLEAIAQLSVDIAREFRTKYPEEIVEAFSLVGKYMTIAALAPTERRNIRTVSNPSICPSCYIHDKQCTLCVLWNSREEPYAGCGETYLAIRAAAESGSFTATAHNIGPLLRQIINRRRQ